MKWEASVQTIPVLKAAVSETRGSAPAWNRLGMAYRRRRDFAEARACFEAAILAEPGAVEHRIALVDALWLDGRNDEAIGACERVLADEPTCTAALRALCMMHVDLGTCSADTRARATSLVRIAPDASSYRVWCDVHRDLGPVKDILDCFDHACGFPSTGEFVFRLGEALIQVGRYTDTRDLLRTESVRHPDDGRLLGTLGSIEHALGNFDEASRLFARTPVVGSVFDDRGAAEKMCYAWRTGAYSTSLAILRQRRGTSPVQPLSEAERRRQFDGRTVLIANDDGGGYGDWIMWARVARLLSALGARVIFESRSELKTLFAYVDGVTDVILPFDEGSPIDDRYTTSDLIPLLDWSDALARPQPYLHPPDDQIQTWRRRLAGSGPGPHAGIEWYTGRELSERDVYTRRPIPPDEVTPLFDADGITWHSLHVGPTRAGFELRDGRVTPLGNDLVTFVDTAAAIAALDFVVTVDTSIIHLAGAVGTPAFLMLPSYPCWRWGDEKTPFDWYPSVERTQQQSPGDWSVPIQEAARFVQAHTRPSIDVAIV